MSLFSSISDASDDLNGYLSNLGGGVLSDIKNTSSSINATGNVVSGLLGPYTSLLGIIGLDGAYQKTIGSILANGFDITCWGSAHPPTKTKGNLEKYYKPYFDQIANNLLNGDLTSINRFIKDVYIVHFQCVAMQTATKWSKCSAKGVKMYLDYMTPLYKKVEELIATMQNAGSQMYYSKEKTNFVLNGYKVEGGENREVQVPQFKANVQAVSQLPQIQTIANTVSQIPKVSVDLSSLTPSVSPILTQLKTGDTSEYTMQGGELSEVKIAAYKKPTEKSSSSFPWWILLALGLS